MGLVAAYLGFGAFVWLVVEYGAERFQHSGFLPMTALVDFFIVRPIIEDEIVAAQHREELVRRALRHNARLEFLAALIGTAGSILLWPLVIVLQVVLALYADSPGRDIR
jgi:hypothetical protein